MKMHYEIFRGINGWYWRIKARNGRIVAIAGEPFYSRSNAKRAVNSLIDNAHTTRDPR